MDAFILSWLPFALSRQAGLGWSLLGLTAGSCCDRPNSDNGKPYPMPRFFLVFARSPLMPRHWCGVFSYSSMWHRGIR